MSSRNQTWMIAAALLAVVVGMVLLKFWRSRLIVETLPTQISRGEFSQAQARFREANGFEPSRNETFFYIGERAAKGEQAIVAAACFAEIPTSDPRCGLSARFQEAQVLLRLNRAAAAEHNFREYLAAVPHTALTQQQFALANKWLVYLLSVELRFEERKVQLTQIHKQGLAEISDSKQLYFPNLLVWSSGAGRERLQEFLKADPGDLHLLIAHARYQTANGNLDQAEATLRDICKRFPNDLTARAALMECLFEKSDWDSIDRLNPELPARSPDDPWVLMRMRGEIALHRLDPAEAIACFEALLKADVTNPWSHMGLAKAYGLLNQNEDRDRELQRSLKLANIRVNMINAREDSPDAVDKLAEACEEIDLKEVAATFHHHASNIRQRQQRTSHSVTR